MAAPEIKNMFRHSNGLKHINTITGDGFSALFVVNTPISDNSGVAHGVEHMVFRSSPAYSKPETLFQLTSLTDAKVNASTFANTTYFHCQSCCPHTFLLALDYLLHGLFVPSLKAKDLHYEIYDGQNKGVIYRELIGFEQANKSRPEKEKEKEKEKEICYGGTTETIGELSVGDLHVFHQRFYHARNITLVTANADIEQVSMLISSLPNPQNPLAQKKQETVDYSATVQNDEASEEHRRKYPKAINGLINTYRLVTQSTAYQRLDDNRTNETSFEQAEVSVTPLLQPSPSDLISQLITLSAKKTRSETGSENKLKEVNQSSLPKLFNGLYQQAKLQIETNSLNNQCNQGRFSDLHNGVWLAKVSDTQQQVATISSYIISAAPEFLKRRIQGYCYATQALTCESARYFVIYTAFDIDPKDRLDGIPEILLGLSQNSRFISMTLELAKIKYAQNYLAQCSDEIQITSTDVSNYLKILAAGSTY